MSARAWFVTGTDTGVGKTHVTAALLRTAASRGLRCAALKPAETGCSAGQDPADAAALIEACGRPLDPEDVCPFRYREPLAPAVARELRQRTFDRAVVRAARERLAAHADLLLVEGAGGLLCPYPDNLSAADVAADLGLPLLIVARAGLGTVNHTLLTLAEARRRGLFVAGVVLSETTPERDLSEHDNASLILARGAPPFAATLPHGALTAEGLLERLLADAETDEYGI
jgi:dethiobiotin synthetase